MTPRELCVLVEGLPDNSWFKRTNGHAWSKLEELVATVTNAIHGLRAQYVAAHGAEWDWTVLTAPELPHERRAREARERREAAKRQYHNSLRRTVIERMLSGELKLADIDMSKSIEETLAA